MKKATVIITVNMLTSLFCFSQSSQKSNYIQKSKNQKTAAWVLLGTGAAIDIVGVIVYPKNLGILGNTQSELSRERTASILLIAGSATMLSSIPFFISGHINKKKALQVAVNTQQLQQLKKGNLYTFNYPALTLRLKL